MRLSFVSTHKKELVERMNSKEEEASSPKTPEGMQIVFPQIVVSVNNCIWLLKVLGNTIKVLLTTKVTAGKEHHTEHRSSNCGYQEPQEKADLGKSTQEGSKQVDWKEVTKSINDGLEQVDWKEVTESINDGLEQVDWKEVTKSINDGLAQVDWKEVTKSINDGLAQVDWNEVAQSISDAFEQPKNEPADLKEECNNVEQSTSSAKESPPPTAPTYPSVTETGTDDESDTDDEDDFKECSIV